MVYIGLGLIGSEPTNMSTSDAQHVYFLQQKKAEILARKNREKNGGIEPSALLKHANDGSFLERFNKMMQQQEQQGKPKKLKGILKKPSSSPSTSCSSSFEETKYGTHSSSEQYSNNQDDTTLGKQRKRRTDLNTSEEDILNPSCKIQRFSSSELAKLISIKKTCGEEQPKTILKHEQSTKIKGNMRRKSPDSKSKEKRTEKNHSKSKVKEVDEKECKDNARTSQSNGNIKQEQSSKDSMKVKESGKERIVKTQQHKKIDKSKELSKTAVSKYDDKSSTDLRKAKETIKDKSKDLQKEKIERSTKDKIEKCNEKSSKDLSPKIKELTEKGKLNDLKNKKLEVSKESPKTKTTSVNDKIMTKSECIKVDKEPKEPKNQGSKKITEEPNKDKSEMQQIIEKKTMNRNLSKSTSTSVINKKSELENKNSKHNFHNKVNCEVNESKQKTNEQVKSPDKSTTIDNQTSSSNDVDSIEKNVNEDIATEDIQIIIEENCETLEKQLTNVLDNSNSDHEMDGSCFDITVLCDDDNDPLFYVNDNTDCSSLSLLELIPQCISKNTLEEIKVSS